MIQVKPTLFYITFTFYDLKSCPLTNTVDLRFEYQPGHYNFSH